MSVDFPASYPAHTASAGKPADVQTLQETFAAVLRSFGTEKGTSPTNTLLEVLRPAPSDNNEDRNQQRRETQQNANKTDFAQLDQKSLNKLELRNSEMNADYQHRRDRSEALQNDYRERVVRREPQQSVPPQTTSNVPSPDAASPNETVPSNGSQPLSQPQHVVEVAGANNQAAPVSAAAPNSGAPNVGQVQILMSPGTNTPASMPIPVAPQTSLPQTFTVFSPSGRLGQQQEKPEDEEEEKEEESAEDKPAKKKQPFAVLEAIRAETTRPIQRNVLRQSKESSNQSEVHRVAEKPRERPKEVEPAQARSVLTLNEFLNMSPHHVAVQKGEESSRSEHMRYLNRVAAACEAAAQHAPIRMKINLDHLGTLTLRFYYKSDKLALRFETPSRESALFIRNNLEELRTILVERNVKIVDIEMLWEE